MTETLLIRSSTDSSTLNPSNSATPQTLKSTNIPQHLYGQWKVHCNVYVESTGTSTAQTLTFTITVDAETKSYIYKTKAAADVVILPLEFITANQTENGVVTVTLDQAGAADANTSVIAKDFEVVCIN